MLLSIEEHSKKAGYAHIGSISYSDKRSDVRQWNIHQTSLTIQVQWQKHEQQCVLLINKMKSLSYIETPRMAVSPYHALKYNQTCCLYKILPVCLMHCINRYRLIGKSRCTRTSALRLSTSHSCLL
jgi:DUF438 domain-containing protein